MNTATATATADRSTSIHARALLVWLTISTWTARKYDRAVSNKVAADNAATLDAGRYNKHLLPVDAPSYKTLTTIAAGIRQAHYSNTLSWSDEGWRLLPTANYLQYTSWYREQQRALEAALDAFCYDYPQLRDAAAVKLGRLYRDEDYPALSDIRKRFALDVSYAPIPASGDLRVDLAADQVSDIAAAISARTETATAAAMRDAWQRLYDVVARIHERLSQPDAIFRDSLIGNARDICSALQRLNVTDDPDLERMREAVEKGLTAYDPDEIRDYPQLRAQTAQRADDILKKMSGYFEIGA